MDNAYLNIAAQYHRESACQVRIRPYQVKGPLNTGVELFLDSALLPEPGHGRSIFRAQVQMTDAQGAVCLELTSEIEAIVISKGLTNEELQQALRHNIALTLLGAVRVQLQFLSANTGYPLVTLPPVESPRLAGLPPLPALPVWPSGYLQEGAEPDTASVAALPVRAT